MPQEPQPGPIRHQRRRFVARPVARTVVDDDHLEFEATREGPIDLGEERRQIAGLVEDRDDDGDLGLVHGAVRSGGMREGRSGRHGVPGTGKARPRVAKLRASQSVTTLPRTAPAAVSLG